MKKLGILLMAALLCLSVLTGCDKAKPAPGTDGGPPQGDSDEPAVLTRGRVDEGVYRSDYADVSFTLPDGWEAATDEATATAVGVNPDMLGSPGMAYPAEALMQQSIYDAMLTDPATGSNIVFMFENLAVVPGSMALSGPEYLGATKAGLEAMDMGYAFPDDALGTATLADREFAVLRTGIDSLGVEQCYYAARIDDYIYTVVISLFGDADMDTVSANFS